MELIRLSVGGVRGAKPIRLAIACGYARALVRFLAAQILAAGKTPPYLHVKSENEAKVVYQKIGFRLRAAIWLTVISLR